MSQYDITILYTLVAQSQDEATLHANKAAGRLKHLFENDPNVVGNELTNIDVEMADISDGDWGYTSPEE